MKVLITGATGLVGRRLCAKLASHKISVNYLTTHKSEIRDEPHYRGFFWNPENDIIDEKCLEGVHTIVHLAGASISKRWTRKYKQQIVESRVLSANLLLKLLKENPNEVRHFVSASAIGIYKDSLSIYHDEESKEFDAAFLGSVVQKWEAAADRFASIGLKVAKVRTGLVLAKEGGMLPQVAKPVQFGFGTAFGNGKQWQSWVHIQDLVSMYTTAIEESWEGVFNAAAPHPVSNEAFVKATAKVLKKPFFLPNIPAWLLKLALGEMSVLLLSSQKVKPGRPLHFGFRFQYERLEPALENLLQ